MAKFYYKKGPIEVTTPWERPSKSKFKKWLKDFWAIEGIKNYKIWLCGGFLSNRETWDIDIILTGIPNYQELERIMIEGTRIGFEKYNMLFDIQHHDIIPNFYPKKRKVKKIVFCDRIIKNNKVITDWTDSRKVSDNLWIVERIMPNPKQYKKILNGYKFLNPIEISKKDVWTSKGIWKFMRRLLK